ncbi:MAG: hypothetical protein COA52_06525 [Hyphomicrobiales bacterium]|nr:MAG: hypothetical protein COA52_06525 [Hyphomicrobiales bacterium]
MGPSIAIEVAEICGYAIAGHGYRAKKAQMSKIHALTRAAAVVITTPTNDPLFNTGTFTRVGKYRPAV